MSGTLDTLGREAREIADEWEWYVESLVDGSLDEARRRAAASAFHEQYPALAAWKDYVLRQLRRHPKPIVAAALEVMALECTLAGEEDLATRARAAAIRIVTGPRFPQRPHATGVLGDG